MRVARTQVTAGAVGSGEAAGQTSRVAELAGPGAVDEHVRGGARSEAGAVGEEGELGAGGAVVGREETGLAGFGAVLAALVGGDGGVGAPRNTAPIVPIVARFAGAAVTAIQAT